MKRTLSILYKLLIVLTALTGIALQCGAASGRFDFSSFRMFTTLSNLAVAIYFLAAAVHLIRRPDSDVPGIHWKFLVTMGILLTGLVAYFMLRGMFDALALPERFGITLLHDAVPVLTLLDWILFDQKGKTRLWMPLFAASFPVLYAAVSLIAAHWMSGENRYPYPFLNADALGWSGVGLNILLLALGYFAAGYLACGIDRLAGKRKRTFTP